MQTQLSSLKTLSGAPRLFLGALFVGIVLLSSACMPVSANSLFSDDSSDTPADSNSSSTDSSGDQANQLPQSPAPDLSMSSFGGGNDPLSAFGPSSGTVVGNRAVELHDSILRLRASVNSNTAEFTAQRNSGAAGSVQYHSTVAAIMARLQNGTTKGNPILQRQWEEANASLQEVTTSLNRLNSLKTAIDSNSAMSSYLMESVQAAFQLSGAVDEDHDQLKLLRDEISRQSVQLEYLHSQVASDIQHQTAYLATERANLEYIADAISRGELSGAHFPGRPMLLEKPIGSMTRLPGTAQQAIMTAAPLSPVSKAEPATLGHLLVLIRFNEPHVDYQEQLSKAVSEAIDSRPNASFSIVAVAPAEGGTDDLAQAQQVAHANAEEVKQSLQKIGVAASKISIADAQVQAAQSPEVHIYIH